MISNPQEEKQKDDVLQQINDALEKENWGGNCERLFIKIVFNGKFNIQPVCIIKKFDK